MRSTILALLAAVGFSGCSPFLTIVWEDGLTGTDAGWYYYDPAMQVERASIDGALGPYEAQDTEAWGWATTWESGLMFDIRGRGNGVVMAMAHVEIPEMGSVQAGDRLGVDFDGWADMIVCAGEQEDYWDIDVGAGDAVALQVVEVTDDALTVEFSTEPTETEAPVSGEVVIPRL